MNEQLLAYLAAVIFCLIRTVLVPNDRKRNDLFSVVVALSVPAGCLTLAVANLISSIRPVKYDLYIYRIDGLLGFHPSFLLGQFLARHIWFENVTALAYNLLTMAVVVVFAAYLWGRPKSEFAPFVKTFLFNLGFAPLCYIIIPVAGPMFQFPGFPLEPQTTQIVHPMALLAAPNGVPSVHFSTALLIFWFSRRWLIGGIAAFVFLILIAVATMGLGQHYMFDLIAAIPYTFFVYKIAHFSVFSSSVEAFKCNDSLIALSR